MELADEGGEAVDLGAGLAIQADLVDAMVDELVDHFGGATGVLTSMALCFADAQTGSGIVMTSAIVVVRSEDGGLRPRCV